MFNQGPFFLKLHNPCGVSPVLACSKCHQKFCTEQFQLSCNVKVQENIFNSVKTFARVRDDTRFFSIFKIISLQFTQGLPATTLPNLFFFLLFQSEGLSSLIDAHDDLFLHQHPTCSKFIISHLMLRGNPHHILISVDDTRFMNIQWQCSIAGCILI